MTFAERQAKYGTFEELDPGIRHTVRWLQSEGFNTTDSGDGETKLQGDDPYPCALPFPHVVVSVSPANLYEEADRLWELLIQIGIDVHATFMDNEQLVPRVNVEATYFPGSKTAMILLSGVRDSDLPLRCLQVRTKGAL